MTLSTIPPTLRISKPHFVRDNNKREVLHLIRRIPGRISRAQIAQQLELSRSTVSAAVDELAALGLVKDRGSGESRGGRRPIVLDINRDAGRVLGIDIGATHLLVVAADLGSQVLGQFAAPLDINEGPEDCLAQALFGAQQALARANVTLAEVTAVGVGVPGPVILDAGMVVAPPIMPGWDGFPIRERLREHLGGQAHLLIDNDADLGALGEWWYGAAQEDDPVAFIKVGTGIGCGMLLNGQTFHGARGTAGEIGHVTIDEDGPPCTCGNYGCLEAMAGGRAIAQRAQMAVKAGQRTSLANISPPESLTSRAVAEAAGQGDGVAQQLLADAGRYLGIAVASLINLFNPSLIVIGGGVAQAGEFFLEPVRSTVRDRSLASSFQAVRIVPAALGPRSVALGAVALAAERTFENMISGRV